ncbi:MAG: hypothetical protein B2I17_00470 [Thermoplasmatales archaeon B_DKE]|nr:MAG: hypothetical protein B2I17_00470 [Thermoplasmatales archaeon B_DKE]
MTSVSKSDLPFTLKKKLNVVGEIMKINLDHFSTGYSGKEILHDLTFEVSSPGIYVVLGKNGAGKTTLFRSMTGLLKPYSGTIRYNDVELEKSDVKIAYLGHRDSIPTGLSVENALKFFARVEGVPDESINDVIERFGLKKFLGQSYLNLSQGQRRRVSLAKSLLGEKELMILDEPTSGLDPKISSEIRELMKQESKDRIILYSSHNLYEATDIGSEVIAISEGKILYAGEMSGLSAGHYRIGIRGAGIEDVTSNYTKDGKYYVFDLKSQDEAADLVSRLTSSGAKLYEVRDISNTLERFYDESKE